MKELVGCSPPLVSHQSHVFGAATCFACGTVLDGGFRSKEVCIPNPCVVRCVFHLTGGHVGDRCDVKAAWCVYGWPDGATSHPNAKDHSRLHIVFPKIKPPR